MKSKKPFLEDEDGKPVSRTAFRKMRKAEKRESMLQWFGQNFEDPAQHTSYISAEGGYMWNHGGPYDAKDEIFGMFGDRAGSARLHSFRGSISVVLPRLMGFLPHRGWDEGRA